MSEPPQETLHHYDGKFNPNAPIGTIFSGMSRHVAIERILAFSGGAFSNEGWPAKNLHTDIEVAQAAGLVTVAASGPQYQGYLIGLFVELFGVQWLTNGSMDVKFIRLVHPDSIVTPRATLKSRQPEGWGTRFEFDVECVTDIGLLVLVGEAAGEISDVEGGGR